MTEPQIEVKKESYGSVVTLCTGCGDERTYNHQLPFGQAMLVREAKADAALHECFGAGRTGYVVEPPEEEERDEEGRCLVCIRNSEKQALVRRAQGKR